MILIGDMNLIFFPDTVEINPRRERDAEWAVFTAPDLTEHPDVSHTEWAENCKIVERGIQSKEAAVKRADELNLEIGVVIKHA